MSELRERDLRAVEGMGENDEDLLMEIQTAYKKATRQRTNLKRWMTENFDGFSRKLDEMFPGQIDWIWLTSWFQEKGFRNQDGSDLKKDTVQKIWRRVVEAKSKAGG